MAAGRWEVVIPSHGISINTDDAKDVLAFLNEEVAFYNRLNVNGQNLVFGNMNYGSVSVTPRAVSELSAIINEVKSGKDNALRNYVEQARTGLVLVGAGPTGKRIDRLRETSQNATVILTSVLCPAWFETAQSGAREIVNLFRALAFSNPSNFGFDNLLSAQLAMDQSKEALNAINSEAERLNAFIDDKTKLIDDLENLYRKRLTIQEPAVSWENIAARKTKIWRLWLGLFALLIILPISAALAEWPSFSAAIRSITAPPQGEGAAFSLSGLAAISVPALFYAWLLKNISRVFIQNLNLADDADHRRSLALTYMGLL